MRAWATGTNSTAKDAALLAPLLAEVAGGALRAFIHRSQTCCPRRERRKRNRMPLSPGGLPAGWLAEALSANRYKFGPAHTAGDRYAIVTQRNLRHCRPPSRSGGRQAKAG